MCGADDHFCKSSKNEKELPPCAGVKSYYTASHDNPSE